MFLVVFGSEILKSNERICMKDLPDLYLGPRTNPLNFGDDPDYDH